MNYLHAISEEKFRHNEAMDEIAARYRAWLGGLSNADLSILSQGLDPVTHPEAHAVKWEMQCRMACIISERAMPKTETEKNVA